MMIRFKIKLLLLRIKRRASDWWNWLWAHLVAWLIAFFKFLPAEPSINFFSRLAKIVGPLTTRQRVAMENLERAFPEMTKKQRYAIAIEMWGNMGRLFAEYIFLDKIFDFDPQATTPGLVEVDGIDIFLKLRDEKKPHIFFTAHTGNFELLPICAATFGLNVTALFRPPNNPYIAKRVLKARRTAMGHLVPSKAGAAWALGGMLAQGNDVGMLVDQKFRKGILTKFFNQPVLTNPLLGKLARQYDCDVYPARSIRLPNGRFRLELYDKMELPKKSDGTLDVDATAQKLNDIVESWIREYPGQWMWFHNRWEIATAKQK